MAGSGKNGARTTAAARAASESPIQQMSYATATAKVPVSKSSDINTQVPPAPKSSSSDSEGERKPIALNYNETTPPTKTTSDDSDDNHDQPSPFYAQSETSTIPDSSQDRRIMMNVQIQSLLPTLKPAQLALLQSLADMTTISDEVSNRFNALTDSIFNSSSDSMFIPAKEPANKKPETHSTTDVKLWGHVKSEMKELVKQEEYEFKVETEPEKIQQNLEDFRKIIYVFLATTINADPQIQTILKRFVPPRPDTTSLIFSANLTDTQENILRIVIQTLISSCKGLQESVASYSTSQNINECTGTHLYSIIERHYSVTTSYAGLEILINRTDRPKNRGKGNIRQDINEFWNKYSKSTAQYNTVFYPERPLNAQVDPRIQVYFLFLRSMHPDYNDAIEKIKEEFSAEYSTATEIGTPADGLAALYDYTQDFDHMGLNILLKKYENLTTKATKLRTKDGQKPAIQQINPPDDSAKLQRESEEISAKDGKAIKQFLQTICKQLGLTDGKKPVHKLDSKDFKKLSDNCKGNFFNGNFNFKKTDGNNFVHKEVPRSWQTRKFDQNGPRNTNFKSQVHSILLNILQPEEASKTANSTPKSKAANAKKTQKKTEVEVVPNDDDENSESESDDDDSAVSVHILKVLRKGTLEAPSLSSVTFIDADTNGDLTNQVPERPILLKVSPKPDANIADQEAFQSFMIENNVNHKPHKKSCLVDSGSTLCIFHVDMMFWKVRLHGLQLLTGGDVSLTATWFGFVLLEVRNTDDETVLVPVPAVHIEGHSTPIIGCHCIRMVTPGSGLQQDLMNIDASTLFIDNEPFSLKIGRDGGPKLPFKVRQPVLPLKPAFVAQLHAMYVRMQPIIFGDSAPPNTMQLLTDATLLPIAKKSVPTGSFSAAEVDYMQSRMMSKTPPDMNELARAISNKFHGDNPKNHDTRSGQSLP
jgi:hypothetical protein